MSATSTTSDLVVAGLLAWVVVTLLQLKAKPIAVFGWLTKGKKGALGLSLKPAKRKKGKR